MSVWEFMACVDGWQISNGTKKKKPSDIADDRLAEMGVEGF